MTDVKLAYVVPTKDRPDDMRVLLTSLTRQTRTPDQIVVVDGSDPAIEPVLAEFPDLSIDYVRVFPPSLAKQRNAGMAAVRADIDVAGYLDDDLELTDDATEAMAAFWAGAEADVGGAGFCILDQPVAFSNRLAALFLVDSPVPGKLLASGFNAQIPPLSETTPTDGLYGGATMWRRDVIAAFSFDEWYIGHGYLEDVDFSHRVRRAGRPLFVAGAARVYHHARPIALNRQFDVGRQQIINRLYFIRKLGGFSRLAVAWGLFGQMVLNLGASVRRLDTTGLRRLGGNLVGLAEVLTGRAGQVGGYYK